MSNLDGVADSSRDGGVETVDFLRRLLRNGCPNRAYYRLTVAAPGTPPRGLRRLADSLPLFKRISALCSRRAAVTVRTMVFLGSQAYRDSMDGTISLAAAISDVLHNLNLNDRVPHGIPDIGEFIDATDHTVTVKEKDLMKFLSSGMRMVMMKIRYPRFTAIELWVLAISVIIAAGIQM
jgi:hypothetical protein